MSQSYLFVNYETTFKLCHCFLLRIMKSGSVTPLMLMYMVTLRFTNPSLSGYAT